MSFALLMIVLDVLAIFAVVGIAAAIVLIYLRVNAISKSADRTNMIKKEGCYEKQE